jgi:hypothetical protein
MIVILVGFAVIGLLLLLSYSPGRQRKLSEIIADLESLLRISSPGRAYPIHENIAFFRSLRTLPGYVYWALTRRRRIVAAKLLEIADLPLPRWEMELYKDLSYVERKDFPGLSKPLRQTILQHIQAHPDAKMLELGCGSMEVTRQALQQLKASGSNAKPLIVGVDLARQSWDAIKVTLAELADFVEIRQITSLDEIEDFQPQKPTILFHQGDALEIAQLHGHKFDLLYSSRFRHHLDKNAKAKLDTVSQDLATTVVEYDDYRTAISWIPPILTAWNRPVLMNGSILSQLRQPSKKELKYEKHATDSVSIRFYSPPGSYTRTYQRKR